MVTKTQPQPYLHPQGGQSDGPSTDVDNRPVIDPTKNVLDLVHAAVKRMDDLSEAERKRHDDLRLAEKERHKDLHDAEVAFRAELSRMSATLNIAQLESMKTAISGNKELISILKDAAGLATSRLNDTISRAEHDVLVKALADYKLEVSQTVAAKQIAAGATAQGAEANRTDARASIGTVVLIAGAASAIITMLVSYLRPMPVPQVVTSPPAVVSSEKRVDDVIERLNALSARINQLQPQPK